MDRRVRRGLEAVATNCWSMEADLACGVEVRLLRFE